MTATQEPARLCAGDSATWTKALPEYPASAGWVLSYVLINAAAKHTVASSASGDEHRVALTGADTGAWAAGTYSWRAFVSKGPDRHTVGTGTLVVEPDLAAASITALDTRSPAKAALDAVDEALRNYGSKAWMQSYTINGRQQTFRSNEEFMALRSKLQAEVRREEHVERLRSGLASRNTLQVRTNGRR